MTEIEGLLIDIDGVLVVSWEPIPGTVAALDAIRGAGVACRFLTNTTSRTRADITHALQSAGFAVESADVLTATVATDSYLAVHHPGARCLFVNSGNVSSDLGSVELVGQDADPASVDVVILGGAGDEFTYRALNHALACLLEGASFVAMHRNILWKTNAGLQLDAGAYLMALERASDSNATIIGKPSPAMFEAGLSSMGIAATDAAMIGDDIETDVRAAQAFGITGVQVRTGKFMPGQLAQGTQPDVLVDSFADVPAWLGA